jgi:PPOX class probable FMN-dependent enzyme
VFADVITTEAGLREIYKPPGDGAVRKQIDALDDNCRAFIAHSPLVLVGTADAAGRCDVSPKGGPAGFVRVLDDNRLALPDLYGNNRIDSMRNLLEAPGIGLLFLIPGLDETLRVNGRGYVVRDPDVLDACVVHDRRPRSAIGIVVEEAFIHCAKAFKRGGVWEPSAWPDRSDMPTIPCMVRDHVAIPGVTAEQVRDALERDYAATLWS